MRSLSQDARQLLGDDYAFIQYDPLGRVTASGQVEACSCTVAQALLDDMAFPDRALKTLTDISSTVYDLPFDPLFEAANLRTRVSAAVREDAEGDTVTVQLYAYDDHGNVRKYRTVLEGLGAFDLEYRYDQSLRNCSR